MSVARLLLSALVVVSLAGGCSQAAPAVPTSSAAGGTCLAGTDCGSDTPGVGLCVEDCPEDVPGDAVVWVEPSGADDAAAVPVADVILTADAGDEVVVARWSGGPAVCDELVAVDVVETDDEVVVTVLSAQPPVGPCPDVVVQYGYRVPLDGPVGARTLVVGS